MLCAQHDREFPGLYARMVHRKQLKKQHLLDPLHACLAVQFGWTAACQQQRSNTKQQRARASMAPRREARGTQQADAAAGGLSCEYPWAKEVDQVAAELRVDPHVGLSSDEVERRQEQFGYNELEKEPGALRPQVTPSGHIPRGDGSPHGAYRHPCSWANQPAWRLGVQHIIGLLLSLLKQGFAAATFVLD